MPSPQHLRRILAVALGLLFALQVLVVVPQHHFHAREHTAPAFGASDGHHGRGSPVQTDDCRCDFCVAFASLDSGSVATPPVLGLAESFFSPFASPESVLFTRALLSFRARGPPAMSA